MDVLDDILKTLDLKGVLYFRTNFAGPWGVTVPEHRAAARFHLVTQGRCSVEFESGRSIEMGPGELVLVPRGRTHVLADQPGIQAPALERILESVGYDGRGVLAVGEGDDTAPTQTICGHFSFRPQADHPLLRALPEFIHVTADIRAREAWLDQTLDMLKENIFKDPSGSSAAVTRLSEVIFIETLRTAIGESDELKAVLESFGDRQISRALELIHQMPEQPWTVESLAREAGMSRSVFAERFRDLMGVTPMAYLADWRLQRALSLLNDPQQTIQQVASQTGYSSPAAFSRAFTERFGQPPKQYRLSLAS